MAIRRIEIPDLIPPPLRAVEGIVFEPYMADLPLEVFLGLKDGDTVSIEGGKASIVRASGEREGVSLGN